MTRQSIKKHNKTNMINITGGMDVVRAESNIADMQHTNEIAEQPMAKPNPTLDHGLGNPDSLDPNLNSSENIDLATLSKTDYGRKSGNFLNFDNGIPKIFEERPSGNLKAVFDGINSYINDHDLSAKQYTEMLNLAHKLYDKRATGWKTIFSSKAKAARDKAYIDLTINIEMQKNIKENPPNTAKAMEKTTNLISAYHERGVIINSKIFDVLEKVYTDNKAQWATSESESRDQRTAASPQEAQMRMAYKYLQAIKAQIEDEKQQKFSGIITHTAKRAATAIMSFHETEEKSLKADESMQTKVAGVSLKGKRPTQEDAKCAFSMENPLDKQQPIEVTGVFDGHGGSEASQWVADNLKAHFQELLNGQVDKVGKDNISAEQLDLLMYNTLKLLGPELHNKLVEEQDIRKNYMGGTTATVNFKIGDRLWNFNLGDSRSILVRGSTARALSADHHLETADIRKKVAGSLGKREDVGYLRKSRYDYRLSKERGNVGVNMSHSLGDSYHGTLHRATVTAIDLQPGDRVLLGCDGLFEGGNSCQDVVDAMLELEKKYPNHSSEDLMRNLARAAILDAHYALGLFRVEGSDDNVSAMIYEPSYEEE